MIDLLIVISYFLIVFMVAMRGRLQDEQSADQYYLSSRSLKWYSIAVSTIATNIQGYQFLGMMGSAYLFGLAQANLEINAVQGLLLAAFVFVPLYLREKVVTISQFIKKRLGDRLALFYSLANIFMFATITLGAALFWGAYAAELVFQDYLEVLHPNKMVRISILIIFLGVFSAIYTYFGGLSAVVRTDMIQFLILFTGGATVLFVSIHHLGGWDQLYKLTGDKMHLHLPSDHDKLPWTHMFGLFFLNINYWCANQSVLQRSLAAKSLKHAQVGLMVGGLMKYLMAVIIVVPGIALAGILGAEGLSDPDMSFPYLVTEYIPIGLKGIILCALFASLMSTVDSTFNSLATLWSIDIYKNYINKEASDAQMISAGRKAIMISLCTGLLIGLVLLYLKFENPSSAFTHTLNELRYYINCGIVVLICTAAIWLSANKLSTLFCFLFTLPLNIFLKLALPDMNYFVRAGTVIAICLLINIFWNLKSPFEDFKSIWKESELKNRWAAAFLLTSLIGLHVVFH